MRRAYFLEVLRARLALVPLALLVCGLLRASLSLSQDGEWVASAGQSIGSIVAHALVLPVLAFVSARVDGELGSVAWVLGRPLTRRSLAGFRVLADAIVLGLAALCAQAIVGHSEHDSIALLNDELEVLIRVSSDWWRAPFGASGAAVFHRSASHVGWSPVGWISLVLVACAYALGLVSAHGGRRAAARAATLAAALATFVALPVVAAPASLLLVESFVDLASAPFPVFDHAGTATPSPGIAALAAWIALSPVIAIATALLFGVRTLERRPSAPRLGRTLTGLALVSAMAGATVLVALGVSIAQVPALSRKGTARIAVRVSDLDGEAWQRPASVEVWLQDVGRWRPTDPWVRGRRRPRGAQPVRPRVHRREPSAADGSRSDVAVFSELAAGRYEVCAQVDPLPSLHTRQTRECWGREAATRSIEATCVPIAISADGDQETIELHVSRPDWDGTCPAEAL